MKKQATTTSPETTRKPRKFAKEVTLKVDPIKWAKDLVSNCGAVEALRITKNYSGDTIGKPPHTEPNPFKGFYTQAQNFIENVLKFQKTNNTTH